MSCNVNLSGIAFPTLLRYSISERVDAVGGGHSCGSTRTLHLEQRLVSASIAVVKGCSTVQVLSRQVAVGGRNRGARCILEPKDSHTPTFIRTEVNPPMHLQYDIRYPESVLHDLIIPMANTSYRAHLTLRYNIVTVDYRKVPV